MIKHLFLSLLLLPFLLANNSESITSSVNDKTLEVTLTVTCSSKPSLITIIGGIDVSKINLSLNDITKILNGNNTDLILDSSSWVFYARKTLDASYKDLFASVSVGNIKNSGETYFAIAFCDENPTGVNNSWSQPDNKGFFFRMDVTYNSSISLDDQTFQARKLAEFYGINGNLVYDQNGNVSTSSKTGTPTGLDCLLTYSTYIDRNFTVADGTIYFNNISSTLNQTNYNATLKKITEAFSNLEKLNISILSVSVSKVNSFNELSTDIIWEAQLINNTVIFAFFNLTTNVRLAYVIDYSESIETYSNLDLILQGKSDAGNPAPFSGYHFLRQKDTHFLSYLNGFRPGTNYRMVYAMISEGPPEYAISKINVVSFKSKNNPDNEVIIDIVSVVPSVNQVTKEVKVKVTCTDVPKDVYLIGALNSDSGFNKEDLDSIIQNLDGKMSKVNYDNWRFYGHVDNTTIQSEEVVFKINNIKNSGENYTVAAYCTIPKNNSLRMDSNQWVQPDNGGKQIKLQITYKRTFNNSDEVNIHQARVLASFFNITTLNRIFAGDGNAIIPTPGLLLLENSIKTTIGEDADFNSSTFFGRDYSLGNDDLHTNVTDAFTVNLTNTLAKISPSLSYPPTGASVSNLTFVKPVWGVQVVTTNDSFVFNVSLENTNARVAIVFDYANLSYSYSNQSIFNGKNATGQNAKGFAITDVAKNSSQNIKIAVVDGELYDVWIGVRSEGNINDVIYGNGYKAQFKINTGSFGERIALVFAAIFLVISCYFF